MLACARLSIRCSRFARSSSTTLSSSRRSIESGRRCNGSARDATLIRAASSAASGHAGCMSRRIRFRSSWTSISAASGRIRR
eukprot:3643831-Prymnesium_polylepis.1